MKFGMQMLIVLSSRLLNKMLKFCKFKMADGRHIEKSSFGYISTSDYRINAK